MLTNVDLSITIFVNGNKIIGYGHISRCLILAREFKKKEIPVLFVTPKNCTYTEKIKSEFELLIIDDFSTNELSKFNAKYNGLALIDVIETDFLNFKFLKSRKLFKKIASITLFNFDNSKRFEDVSFYPTFSKSTINTVENQFYSCKQYCGKDYLIFNNSNKIPKNDDYITEGKKDLLVTMGGADPENLTMKLLQSLFETKLSITVILSKQAKYYTEVRDFCLTNTSIELLDFVDNLPSLFHHHKILILNGGLTRYEAILYRIPFVAISIHKLQYSISEEVCKLGVGLNLGIGKELSNREVKTKIVNLLNDDEKLQSMYHLSKGLIDSDGSKRIFDLLINLLKK